MFFAAKFLLVCPSTRSVTNISEKKVVEYQLFLEEIGEFLSNTP